MPHSEPGDRPWHVMQDDFQMKPGMGAVPKPLMPAAE
jgi:hypothetical protein